MLQMKKVFLSEGSSPAKNLYLITAATYSKKATVLFLVQQTVE